MTRKRDRAQTKEIERDADSKKSHPALVDDDIIQQH